MKSLGKFYYMIRDMLIEIPRPREMKFIYYSGLDFIDSYLSIDLILTSLVLILSKPLENIPVYKNLTHSGFTSFGLGTFMFIVGASNLIRVFSPIKPWIPLVIFMKCIMLGLFMFLLFGILDNPVLPLTTGILLMLCVLSLDNIARTK